MDKKVKVEKCKQIRIYPFIKSLLANGVSFLTWNNDDLIVYAKYNKEEYKKHFQLSYRLTVPDSEEVEGVCCWVRLIRTRCYLGGFRYWFSCPVSIGGKTCARKVSVLYLPPIGRYFACRHCYNLTYESRSLTPFKRVCKYFNPFGASKQIEEFPRKIYKGRRTRKYNALLRKDNKGLNYMDNHNTAMLEKLSKK